MPPKVSKPTTSASHPSTETNTALRRARAYLSALRRGDSKNAAQISAVAAAAPQHAVFTEYVQPRMKTAMAYYGKHLDHIKLVRAKRKVTKLVRSLDRAKAAVKVTLDYVNGLKGKTPEEQELIKEQIEGAEATLAEAQARVRYFETRLNPVAEAA